MALPQLNPNTQYGVLPPRFEGPLNHGRFVHNAAPPYHALFRPFRYHPGAARSPLKLVETASYC